MLAAFVLAAGPLIVELSGPPPPPTNGATAWLWLNTLGDARRAEVADRLEGLATRLEARFHPLIHDFEDEPLGDDVRRFLRHHLPGLNSARALSQGRWASSKGTTLRVVGACPAEATCTPSHRLDAHDAFRAWPVAHGIVLEARYLSASSLANHLRGWLPRAHYGLIITAADLQPSPAPRIAAAAKRLHKRLKRLEPKYAEYLEELLTAADPEPVALPIGTDAVWVVPRLSGLGQLDALRGTVHTAVAALPVRWVSPLR